MLSTCTFNFQGGKFREYVEDFGLYSEYKGSFQLLKKFMLKDLKITKKFPLVMISFALISAIATSVIAFINTREHMVISAQDKLIALLESRKSSLQQYFDTIEHDVQFHAQSPLVIKAMQQFDRAWQALPNKKTNYLQRHYIHNNPFPVGKKGSMLGAGDGSNYSRVHRQYHPVFSNMIEARSFYDLFLFDRKGNLIYSVNKEPDFATNVITGPWKDTHLAQVFKGVNDAPEVASMLYIDFLPYRPSSNVLASFIGIPVFTRQHQYLGVLVFQLPVEPLNTVMQVTAGMGKSGETYLVGRDLLMRSDSRFFKDRSILKTKVDTFSVHQGLEGKSGIGIIKDYRNVSVFSAYTAMDFKGTRWAMIVEVDEDEILQPLYVMSNFLLISGIIIAVVIFMFGYFLATDISQPIVTMTRIMRKLSKNDLNINISVNNRDDEIGQMAKAMEIFKHNAIEQAELKTKLTYIAEHDILTGLGTRKYALEKLEYLLSAASKNGIMLVLMFIDLDNFKLINDSHGHDIGDRVLCEVANGLKSCVCNGDIIARIGGDEFIIILPDIKKKDESRTIASNIIEVVCSSFLGSTFIGIEETKKLGLSIGLSVFPDDASDASSLLRKADSAMYSVKKNGKNNFEFWNESMS